MEASALQAPPAAPAITAPGTLARPTVAIGTPLLRFRSDEQLVDLFRGGHDEAFRAIHERYHKRLFAYARQMLPARQDAEEALQDVFVRAYYGLRSSDRRLALRAWLFRIAHNRCIDELRRPGPPPPEVLHLVRSPIQDPLAEVDLRESLRRLIGDIRRLPDQQRSALLMRELGGMSYADLACSLGVSVGAVKSLLVRARIALAQAADARDTACVLIREELVEAHDRGMRPNANARKHIRDCPGCRSFRRELRGVSRQLAAIAPAAGPLGVLAKVLGVSGGAGGGAMGGAGGGAALLGGGATASAGGVGLGVGHLATLIVAAMATAGGAVELQSTIIAAPHHRGQTSGQATRAAHARQTLPPIPATASAEARGIQAIARVVATVSTTPAGADSGSGPASRKRPSVGGASGMGLAFTPGDSASAGKGSSSTTPTGTGTGTSSTTTGTRTCVSTSTAASAPAASPATTTTASTSTSSGSSTEPAATASCLPAVGAVTGNPSSPSANGTGAGGSSQSSSGSATPSAATGSNSDSSAGTGSSAGGSSTPAK